MGLLKAGRTRTFEFTMRLGEPGTGALTLRDEDRSSTWDRGRQDDDPAKDHAVISVAE